MARDELDLEAVMGMRTIARSFGRVLLWGCAAICGAHAGERVVLPATVTPEHYRIDLVPDAGSLTFKATVAIDVTVHQTTNELALNSADIVIDSAALSGEARAPAIRHDEATETTTFALDHALKPGAYTLMLAYHGKIYQRASGLFALDYETPQGKARALFTQFENSDARRFVPSWDEPARKATFELTATVPADQTAISNMPVASTELLGDHLKRVHFATTPKMSSYLLYFGAGDFERVARKVGGVDVGVVVKRGDTLSAGFALDAASDILPYYNSYFGTPYPLPKLDLIAAPGSSPFFGAMENWGAIFYFERDLLIDARLATAGDKQRVYIVVAHEMAHQWFGDLVTMAWWDDLWLNEGFASWMENKVTDHFHPDWKVWLQSAEETQAAMQEDARDGTHPIVTPIDDVLQASSAFDSITYLKGAAVIRMLESYVGEKAFRAGVRRYMHDHAYGNTVTDDLWKEIDKETQRPITQIAHDFTLQAGVPMVSERSRLCRDGQATLRLSQEHFAVDAASTTARLWHIPVISAHPAGPTVTTIVAGGAPTTVRLAGCGALIINAGQTGYFRSRYSSDGMAAIGADYRSLSPEDQLGVLNDSSALADSGLESTAALLNLTKELPADADPVVAATLVDLFEQLDIIYDGLPTQAAFRAYARGALDPLLARVGWDARPGEADNDALLRSDLLAALGYFADPAVLAEARKRFDRYLDDPSRLDAGGRRTVLGIVAAHADAPTWDRLHGMARSAKTEIERQELYDLLASAQDATLVSQALELALSGEPPPTIAPEMIIAASRRHPATAFQFAISHWDRLAPLIVPTALPSFIPRLLGSASNTDLIGQLDAFAQAHIPAGARQDLRKAEANVRHLARIRSDRLPAVDRWITQERGAGGR